MYKDLHTRTRCSWLPQSDSFEEFILTINLDNSLIWIFMFQEYFLQIKCLLFLKTSPRIKNMLTVVILVFSSLIHLAWLMRYICFFTVRLVQCIKICIQGHDALSFLTSFKSGHIWYADLISFLNCVSDLNWQVWHLSAWYQCEPRQANLCLRAFRHDKF